MPRIYIPHRIPPQDQIARLVSAGMASQADVDAALLDSVKRFGRPDWQGILTELLDGREPPWVENITGKLQLALDDGSVIEFPIRDGVAEVPKKHLDHALAGVRGSYVVKG